MSATRPEERAALDEHLTVGSVPAPRALLSPRPPRSCPPLAGVRRVKAREATRASGVALTRRPRPRQSSSEEGRGAMYERWGNHWSRQLHGVPDLWPSSATRSLGLSRQNRAWQPE